MPIFAFLWMIAEGLANMAAVVGIVLAVCALVSVPFVVRGRFAALRKERDLLLKILEEKRYGDAGRD